MRICFQTFSAATRSFPLRVFALLFVVGIFLVPNPAEAFILSELVGTIAVSLGTLYSLILGLQAAIINWLINPAFWGEAFTKNPTIVASWRIVRDFANLGFVLAIMVIAIGFILRLQTYGSNRTLTRLIVAAVLVNFSLVIAGVFIDAANIMTRFFMTGFGVMDGQIGWRLADATGARAMHASMTDLFPQGATLLDHLRVIWHGLVDDFSLVHDFSIAGRILFNTLFVTIFFIMAVAALGALIVMLLIRVAHLWFLLIFAPLAWLSWVFPAFESNWKQWWQVFLRWTFFAPIVTFFLMLSLAIISNPRRPLPFLTEFPQDAHLVESLRNERLPLAADIARFTLAIALIMFGLTAANQMGITFADQGVKWASAAGKWPGATAWKVGAREGRRRFATSRVGQRLEGRFAGSRVFGGVSDWIRKTRMEPKEDIKNLIERYKHPGFSPQTRRDVTLGRGVYRGRGKEIAIAGALSMSKDEFGALDAPEQQRLVSLANSVNPDYAKELLRKAPSAQLITHYDQTVQSISDRFGELDAATGNLIGSIEGFARKIELSDIPKLPETFLKRAEVLNAFSVAQIRKIVNEADATRIQAVKTAFLTDAALGAKLAELRKHPDLQLVFGQGGEPAQPVLLDEFGRQFRR